MNYQNFSQKTNFTAGSEKFSLLPFYLTSVNIPGLNFSQPSVGGRGSTKLNLASDSVQYNDLSFELMVDEDLNIYYSFMEEINKSISVEGSNFADRNFDFWVEINNSKGHKIMKLEFYNCRIASIGDISLETQDEETFYTMSVELKYDYFNINKDDLPKLKI